MSRAWYYLRIIGAVLVIYWGVSEFGNAKYWIPLVRGLFWIVLGCLALGFAWGERK